MNTVDASVHLFTSPSHRHCDGQGRCSLLLAILSLLLTADHSPPVHYVMFACWTHCVACVPRGASGYESLSVSLSGFQWWFSKKWYLDHKNIQNKPTWVVKVAKFIEIFHIKNTPFFNKQIQEQSEILSLGDSNAPSAGQMLSCAFNKRIILVLKIV